MWLTTGAQTLVGTDGDDTINGVSSSLSSARTLDAGDNIDGGLGKDTINVDMQSNFSGFTANVGALKNVEIVNLTNTGSIAREFNATGVTGAQEYNLKGAVNLAGLTSTGATVAINELASGSVSVGFTADAVKGTADTLAVNLNKLGTAEVKAAAGVTAAAAKAVTVTANGIETLALSTTGDNIVQLVGAQVTGITVAGTGTLTTDVTTTTKTFDASANSGAVKVNLTNVTAANSVTSIATGAGDDVITADVNDLRVNAVINGGAGADRLELTGASASTTQYELSGVETVSLGALGGGLTFSAAKTSGVETIEAKATLATTATFAGLGNGSLALNLLGNGAATGIINADHSGASTVTVGSKLAVSAATAEANSIALNLGNSSNVSVNVGQFATYAGQINAAKASSVEVTGKLVGAATLNLAAATSAVLNTTGASTVALNAGKLTSLNATVASNGVVGEVTGLTVTGAAPLTSLESLTVNTAGAFSAAGDLAKVNTVTLSGSGTVALAGKLGAVDLGYGVTVNAEGLKSLTVGQIDTGAGQSINLNAATVLGDVTLTKATVADSNGAVAGGDATGSISVNVNGTTGNVSLGTLTAKTVTVEAAGALGTLNAIVVAESATVHGAGLGVNNIEVSASKAATVTGGIAADFITVTGTASAAVAAVAPAPAVPAGTATFTLTGGLGGDTFTISAGTGEVKATITDFAAGEDILAGGTLATSTAGATNLTVAQAKVALETVLGVTIADAATIKAYAFELNADTASTEAVVTHGGKAYALFSDAVTAESAVVIELAGVTVAGDALTWAT